MSGPWYVLAPTESHGIETVGVQWGAAVEGSARELLGVPDDTGRRSAEDDAVEWLRTELVCGPVSPKQLKARAPNDGHSWITVRRAKHKLGVISRKEGGTGVGWTWRLPEDTHGKGAQSQPYTNEHLCQISETRVPQWFQNRKGAQDIEGALGDQVRGIRSDDAATPLDSEAF